MSCFRQIEMSHFDVGSSADRPFRSAGDEHDRDHHDVDARAGSVQGYSGGRRRATQTRSWRRAAGPERASSRACNVGLCLTHTLD